MFRCRYTPLGEKNRYGLQISKVEPKTHELVDGLRLFIREATAEEARSVLDYVQQVCGESDFLTFGPGEFGFGEQQEKEFLQTIGKQKTNMSFLD
jgi:hypothetical protein